MKTAIETKPNGDGTKTFTEDDVKAIVAKALETQQPKPGNGDGNGNSIKSTTVDDLLNAASKSTSGGVQVKAASERYCTKKSTGRHVKTGETIRDEFGREAQTVCERDSARSGAFLKHLASRAGIGQAVLDDHGRELLEECFGQKWCGKFGAEYATDVDGMKVKALLNDAVSGGAEAVPIFFDSDLISFPLLHSEVFPFIDLRPVPRGSSVEGGSVGNPSLTWGVSEGTDIPLFDTTSLIAAIDTSIFDVTVALEVGRDFLADSPADVGRILTENIGQRLAQELDRVTTSGNGTSEPEGIFTASGLTAVSSDNGGSGPPTLSDYESLMFAIGKQYRNSASRPAFLTNDTTYQRSRAIRIDSNASPVDQRPLFGLGAVNSYVTLDWAHRIENVGVTNTQAAFGALSKYRMYRRMGMSLEWTTQGKELMRKNLALLVVRARFGGQVVDASAFAKITDMQI